MNMDTFYSTRFRKLKFSLKQHITSRAHYINVLNTKLQSEYFNKGTRAHNIEAAKGNIEILAESTDALEEGEIRKKFK